MQYLLLGLGLMIGLWLIAQGFVNADPKRLARTLRWTGIGLAAALVVFLVATGRIGVLLWLGPLIWALLMRWRIMQGRAQAAAGPAAGQTSNVETDSLRMWLDHDTGVMGGKIIAGRYAGRSLADLELEELLILLDELRLGDPQSVQLLEAYLDRSYPDWRGGPGADEAGGEEPYREPPREPPPRGGMSREEAYGVLGLQPGAGEEEIKEAHRRLMLKNHPDQGGSTYIAARINQAKDILLGRRRA